MNPAEIREGGRARLPPLNLGQRREDGSMVVTGPARRKKMRSTMRYSSAGSLIRRSAPRLDLPEHCQLPRQSLMACAATRAALSLLGAAIVVSAGADAPDTLLPEFDLRSAPACYSLLSSAGPIGCRTPVPAGVTAPIALVDSQSDLDALLEQEPISSMQQAKMTAVLLPQPLLTRGNLLALQRSGRCAGVLLAESPTPPPQGFSPADRMPYCRCGSAPPCAGAAWNPHGQNLTQVNLDFPMVLLTAAQTATVRRRMQRASPDPASFPHYMVHMNYYMDAFEGYALRPGDGSAGAGHSWWETQAAATCCAHCQPSCGTLCCAPGFECLAPLPHSEVRNRISPIRARSVCVARVSARFISNSSCTHAHTLTHSLTPSLSHAHTCMHLQPSRTGANLAARAERSRHQSAALSAGPVCLSAATRSGLSTTPPCSTSPAARPQQPSEGAW